MHSRALLLFVLLLSTLAVSGVVQAQPEGANSEPLVVGTKVAPPFVTREADGRLSGISIELWRQIADELGLDYELRELELQELLTGLQNGTLDASVAALTVTAAREEVIDFTHPFHTTGLAIATPREGSAVWTTIKRLFSWEFLLALLALGGLLLLVGFVFWLTERHRNAEMFGGTPAEGIGASFWWAAVTMTTVGYGDKAPITFAGRVVALVWMFAAIILISSFTAAIATSLTVSRLESRVQGPDDLPQVSVATVAHSASADYLRQRGIGFTPREDLPLALDELAAGRYDALVYDKPILQYLSNQSDARQIQVLPNSFERQDYGIAFPEGSDLRGPVNQKLLEVIASDEWQALLQRYLGREEG